MISYSFIIPHYNTPVLLERLLDSIPQRKDIEVIVVDDNSASDKKPIVNRTDVNVVYLQAEDSKGAGHARNVGLKQAIGKWLLFADADDYYINNFIEKLDEIKDSKYDIIFFDYDTNLSTNKDGFQKSIAQMLQGGKRAKANFKHSLNAPWNKMYKRRFVMDNNIQFEEIPIQNDAYFVHKASSLTDNFYYVNEKLYFYEINDNGITRKNRKKEDIERSITTLIKIDKLKAKSGAWNCIYAFISGRERFRLDYGYWFVIKQQIRRICHGLVWFLIRKYTL